jgi:hypothetical protein
MTKYMKNMSPHRILGDKTLEESFLGVKLEISDLRIFGFIVYIHVPREKMKMDPSRQKGIFVGYIETSNSYRIFILVQGMMVVRKYVNFKENLTSKSTQESPIVTDDEDQQDLKDEEYSVVQTLGGEEVLSPSSLVKRPRWLLLTLRDFSEILRSVFKGIMPPKKFMNYIALMSRIIDAKPSIF